MTPDNEHDLIVRVERLTQETVLKLAKAKDFRSVQKAYTGLGDLFEMWGYVPS